MGMGATGTNTAGFGGTTGPSAPRTGLMPSPVGSTLPTPTAAPPTQVTPGAGVATPAFHPGAASPPMDLSALMQHPALRGLFSGGRG